MMEEAAQVGPVQSGKIKERKRAQKVRSHTRSFPQIPLKRVGSGGKDSGSSSVAPAGL